eukprot:gene631-692_t
MNLDQPKRQHNYTNIGFKKMVAPKEAWDLISGYWNANNDKMKLENWPPGNTYTNNWKSPTYMVSLEDSNLRGSGNGLKRRIWDAMRPTLEEWVGHKLKETSIYGIRVYKEGAILATHVDRLPLVTSCIVQVAQDVDEPWPVEVYDHSGKAHNVTMKPGEIVLYESHTVLHGRPFPLKGRFYANLFIHFIPVDHEEMNSNDVATYTDSMKAEAGATSQVHPFEQSRKDLLVGGHEQSNHAIEEIAKHHVKIAVEEEVGQRGEEEEEEVYSEEDLPEVVDGGLEGPALDLHEAAMLGDVDLMQQLLSTDPALINSKDANNWQPLHEAVRAGSFDAVQYLVESGADLDGVTMRGGTPLWWARRTLEEDDPIISYLEEIGAPDEGEDL